MRQAAAPTIGHPEYDANGHLSKAVDTGGSRTFTYANNAQGLVLHRTEAQAGNAFEHLYYYAAGRRIGDVSTDPTDKYRVSYAEQLAQSLTDTDPDKFKDFKPVTSADFDQNYEPINASYPSASASSYTARGGETLRAIAQSVWGDSAMWFLIAEANGLRDDVPLVAGQVLVIPNKVTNIHNNAGTVRPYNPGEVIGHIDPSQPEELPVDIPDNPANWGSGGDRMGDYSFISMWDAYHDALAQWGGGLVSTDPKVSRLPPPVSPNNAAYGRGLDDFMRATALTQALDAAKSDPNALIRRTAQKGSDAARRMEEDQQRAGREDAAAQRWAYAQARSNADDGLDLPEGISYKALFEDSGRPSSSVGVATGWSARAAASVLLPQYATSTDAGVSLFEATGNGAAPLWIQNGAGTYGWGAFPVTGDLTPRFTGPAIDGLPAGSTVLYSIDEAGQQYADLRGPAITGGYQRIAVGLQQPESLGSVLVVGKSQPDIDRYEAMKEAVRDGQRVDTDELVNLARRLDPGNAFAQRATPTERLTDFGITTAIGVVSLPVGGAAFNALTSVRVGMGARSALILSSMAGDATFQAGQIGVNRLSGGKYGVRDFSFTELAVAGAAPIALGGRRAIRELAGELRGAGLPDWNIRPAPFGVLNANPFPFELEPIGKVGNALPEGLAYRLDLPKHLAGPDGFTKSSQLSGTHNLNNATAALDAKGATYTLTSTATDGISELSYSYVKPTSGKTITGSKTVYDPAVFSDQTMLDYSLNAGREGWIRYLANPATMSFDVTHGGVNFRAYVNVDQYGNPFIGNVHPIK